MGLYREYTKFKYTNTTTTENYLVLAKRGEICRHNAAAAIGFAQTILKKKKKR